MTTMPRELTARYGPCNREESIVIDQLLTGTSRLSPQLRQILSGYLPDMFACFAQFMELYSSLHYLRFWTDVEAFRHLCCLRISPAEPHSSDRDPSRTHSGFGDLANVTSAPEKSRVARGNSAESPVHSTRDASDRKEIEDTALRIYTRYIAHDAMESLGIGPEMRQAVLENICPADGASIQSDCFQDVQLFVFAQIHKRFFAKFLQSTQYRSFISSSVLAGKVNLADVINFHHTLAMLLEFAENFGFLYYVQFIMSGVQFEAQWGSAWASGNYDTQWAQNDAMVIYDQFVSLQATKRVPCSDSLRELIEENICAELGVRPDCFRMAVQVAYFDVEEVYLRMFLDSEPIRHYLADSNILVGSANVNKSSGTPMSARKREKSASRSGSFISRASSMPHGEPTAERCREPDSVSEIPSSGRHARSLSRASTEGSSSELSKGDAKSRKMTMGKVDALGRFVMFTEQEPVGPPDGLFARAARKLNNPLDAQRKEYEATLEAQRIIEDTLSQCLSFD